jgi:hypothetical protein
VGGASALGVGPGLGGLLGPRPGVGLGPVLVRGRTAVGRVSAGRSLVPAARGRGMLGLTGWVDRAFAGVGGRDGRAGVRRRDLGRSEAWGAGAPGCRVTGGPVAGRSAEARVADADGSTVSEFETIAVAVPAPAISTVVAAAASTWRRRGRR